ncbi:MAG: menaquinone biosynthesis protein [Flavobacteriales bacterium]|nr:menaquinone biosynthesis protein [Flavobacteriales bacterium]
MVKYKVSAVSYLNTVPFIHGLKQSELIHNIDLQLDYPSICADKLINGTVDLALVPVAVIPKLKDSYIISDYCIGADGAVDTVCLYSDVPITEIESIALDYQSRTSVSLLKILLKEYWELKPEPIKADVGFEDNIKGNHAALVIGDRAFALNTKHAYIYDLPAIWKEITGLPFVFAAWVANKKLPQNFISNFNTALEKGLSDIDRALALEGDNYPNCTNPEYYLNNKISYNLDAEKKKGMELFMKKVSAL